MTELEGLPSYRRGLEEHAASVLNRRVDVTVHGLEPGSYGGLAPSDVLGYPYAYHVVLSQVLDAVRQAERSGFDAFVVGSFSEPFLRALRSAVDIPVVGLTESNLLVGCAVGARLGFVTNGPAVRDLVSHAVREQGLWERVNEVTALDSPLTEDEIAIMEISDIVSRFESAAAGVVARGADVVVPAEGVLANAVREGALVEVEGAPVVDCFAVAWHWAESLVRLHASTGLTASRIAFPRAPEDMVARVNDAAARRMVARVDRFATD